MNSHTDNRGPLRIAPLQNVQLTLQLAHRVLHAPEHLTNWGCLYAPPGYGKTTAIAYVQIKLNAIVIEARTTWTQSAVIEALEKELSITPRKEAVYKREERVIEALSAEPRLIIFDEANHLCKKKVIDVIREVSFISRSPVILAGTETLKQELQDYPVAASRVLEWLPGRPCSTDDVDALARLYGEGISISPDLLKHFLQETKGVTRQVVANIDRARELARTLGTSVIDRATFIGKMEVFAGAPAESWAASMRKMGAAA
jgi:hypothetical protein